MVCGDIVAYLQCYACGDVFGKRLVDRERLDVRTAEYLHSRCFLGRCGRNYHIVVYHKVLRHHIRRHCTDRSRVGKYAGYRGYSRSLGRYEVDLTVLSSRAALEVSVEGTE